MPRKGISAARIESTIIDFVKQGKPLTVARLRSTLGGGSLTTIHKRLAQWKDMAFKNMVEDPADFEPACDHALIEKHTQEIEKLQDKLNTQETQNKLLSKELVDGTQLQQQQAQMIKKLSENLEEITQRFKSTSLEYEKVKLQLDTMQSERDAIVELVLKEKNTRIGLLEKELMQINQAYLNAVKEVGREGDDLLILEKAKVVNLNDKLQVREAEIKQLSTQLEKERKISLPLKNKIKEQQDLIRRHISWEQLEAVSKKKKQEEFEHDRK